MLGEIAASIPQQRSRGEFASCFPRADEAAYASDSFRINCFKILECNVRQKHEWISCPYRHPGERATRRSLQHYNYCATMCGDMQQMASCPRGDTCHKCHNIFELWLHPMKYRTIMCKGGSQCPRITGGGICFFAHSQSELRQPTETPPPLDDSCRVQRSVSSSTADAAAEAAAACNSSSSSSMNAPHAPPLSAHAFTRAASGSAGSGMLLPAMDFLLLHKQLQPPPLVSNNSTGSSGMLPLPLLSTSGNSRGLLACPVLQGGLVMDRHTINGAGSAANSSCLQPAVQSMAPAAEQQQASLVRSSRFGSGGMSNCTWPTSRLIGSLAGSDSMTAGPAAAAATDMLQLQQQQHYVLVDGAAGAAACLDGFTPQSSSSMLESSATLNRPQPQLQQLQPSFQRPAANVTEMLSGLVLEASQLSAQAAVAQAEADAAQKSLEAWMSAAGLAEPAAVVSNLSPLEAALLSQQSAVTAAPATSTAGWNMPHSAVTGDTAALGQQHAGAAAAACNAAAVSNVSGGACTYIGQAALAGEQLGFPPTMLLSPAPLNMPPFAVARAASTTAAATGSQWQPSAAAQLQLQQHAGCGLLQPVQAQAVFVLQPLN